MGAISSTPTGLAVEIAEPSGGSSIEDANEENPTFSSHMADAGTDSYDRDLALSILSSEQDFLYQINQALDQRPKGTQWKVRIDRANQSNAPGSRPSRGLASA